MVRAPRYDRNGLKKGAWSEDEDARLRAHVREHGHQNWRMVPSLAGLKRCGKSCRLRWVNYLKPGLKHGKFTKFEEDLIIKMHDQVGNKWSAMAAKLHGRTDHEIKNHWHAHLKKRNQEGNSNSSGVANNRPSPEADSSSCSIVTSSNDHPQNEGFLSQNPQNFDADGCGETSNQICFSQVNSDLLPFSNDQQELDDLDLDIVFNNGTTFSAGYSSNTGGIITTSFAEESFSPQADLDFISMDDLIHQKEQAFSAENPENHGVQGDLLSAETYQRCFDKVCLDMLPFSYEQPSYDSEPCQDFAMLNCNESNFFTAYSMNSSWITSPVEAQSESLISLETNYSLGIVAAAITDDYDHHQMDGLLAENNPENMDAIRNILCQVHSEFYHGGLICQNLDFFDNNNMAAQESSIMCGPLQEDARLHNAVSYIGGGIHTYKEYIEHEHLCHLV